MNEDTVEFLVTSDEHNQRIDKVVSLKLSEYSRVIIKEWIESGNILLENQIVKPSTKVQEGNQIKVTPVLKERSEIEPQKINLDIIYEDNDLIIVNKPQGLVVHPGHGNYDSTLQHGLLFHDEELRFLPRAGLIHRLDKDTSGLLIVAKNNNSYNSLNSAMQSRLIKREYRAICVGEMTSGGTVNEHLSRDPNNRIKFRVSEDGKNAVTHFRVLKKLSGYTFVGLQLETGRTHQIRVHMSHIRYPILGDSLYGTRLSIPKAAKEGLVKQLRSIKRQALHAFKLDFIHPVSGDQISFSNDLPEDMELTIKELSGNTLDKKTINNLSFPDIKV